MFVTTFLGHQGWMIRSARSYKVLDLALRHRLTLFARKPTPVEVSYLGFVDTTGVAASDCRLTDAPRFARKAEAAYRDVCRRWCASTEAA